MNITPMYPEMCGQLLAVRIRLCREAESASILGEQHILSRVRHLPLAIQRNF
jgi:hypothetical protein